MWSYDGAAFLRRSVGLGVPSLLLSAYIILNTIMYVFVFTITFIVMFKNIYIVVGHN